MFVLHEVENRSTLVTGGMAGTRRPGIRAAPRWMDLQLPPLPQPQKPQRRPPRGPPLLVWPPCLQAPSCHPGTIAHEASEQTHRFASEHAGFVRKRLHVGAALSSTPE